MKYADCFNESMKGAAHVKCTYAEVCNEKGTPIFVFQSDRFPLTVATAAFDPSAIRPNSKIVATLTQDAVDVLTEYYKTYVLDTRNHEKRHRITSNHKYLRDYFDENGEIISREVTINPYRYDWVPLETTNNKKSNLALLVAAGSALID